MYQSHTSTLMIEISGVVQGSKPLMDCRKCMSNEHDTLAVRKSLDLQHSQQACASSSGWSFSTALLYMFTCHIQ